MLLLQIPELKISQFLLYEDALRYISALNII
jgi:hypothetical protein